MDRCEDDRIGHSASIKASRPRGCYGIQVLIAGRSKQWRDQASAQIRSAGYRATVVDSGIDALTILVLGLPVDVLVTGADLHGTLKCSRLAQEARALRPGLGIVFAKDIGDQDAADPIPDALVIPPGAKDGVFATTVREALAARAH